LPEKFLVFQLFPTEANRFRKHDQDQGGSSLSASNDPLIVIDGVPLDNGGIAGGNNPLSFINANDIESFTVLKDASAAAIYGTRAANGLSSLPLKKAGAIN
jgi:iron complex outermembrane receptor protein